MQFHNAVAMLWRWHNLLLSFQEKSSSFFEGDCLKLSLVEIIRQSDDRAFHLGDTLKRLERGCKRRERTQSESHSVSSWADRNICSADDDRVSFKPPSLYLSVIPQSEEHSSEMLWGNHS